MGRGPGSIAALELGSRIRQRRRVLGLTQRELGDPMTRAFVSLVERGRSLPSLAALCLFADRLQTTVGELVDGVNSLATVAYTYEHESHEPADCGRRRGVGASHREPPAGG